ncbi:hypothetical protein RRG08_042083 [Elysia crispata]|uniref:Uncharacterized protein n=1 Tax=Elysia crispata TaxID=231223 RepID=A0AAE0Z824_9GAST|nr:hypothetical protein RRG08_042083 [Elysia crispata]
MPQWRHPSRLWLGCGNSPKLQAVLKADRESQETRTGMEALPRRSSKPYLSEIWFLRDKITKIEGKFETLSDRLDRKLSQNIDTRHRRASTLERVSSVETDFSSRLSRLEDRVSSILLSESPDSSSDVAESLADMERRLEDLTAAVEQVNVSKMASPDGGHQDVQPVVCERGMGDRITKTYRIFYVTSWYD